MWLLSCPPRLQSRQLKRRVREYPHPARSHLRGASVSVPGTITTTHTFQLCLRLPPGCVPFSAFSSASPPRDPLPAGDPLPSTLPCACCSLSPAGRPRGAGCLTVGSEQRGQRAGGAIEWQCWLAALAACLAASLTGCQLAPRMLGPVSLPCVLGGRGARDTAREWGPTGAVGCLGELLRVWLSPWSIRFLPPAPGRAGRQVLHRARPGLGL